MDKYHSNSETSFKRPGFTLVELLVVIAIIGLLSTLAVVGLGRARAKARDIKRAADVKQLQTALQLYFEDFGDYPGTPIQRASDCNPQIYDSLETVFDPLVTGGYLGQVPHDPRHDNNPDPWCYIYHKNDPLDCNNNSQSPYYSLIISMETTDLDLPQHGNLLGAHARYCFTNN